MDFPFHAGERAVQARAGTRAMAERVGRGIHPTLWPAAAAFLVQQRLAVIAARDAAGAVWASLLSGEPGLIEVRDAGTLRVAAQPSAADPLGATLATGASAGLLVIDLATRRRVRVNGFAVNDGVGLALRVEQAYGNCPKYIQARTQAPDGLAGVPEVVRGAELSVRQRSWIREADTFFIASAAEAGGADASHRGGPGGFVRVDDARTLRFPDYAGNQMFNTLGNLAQDPRCGLLFVDFGSGATLQLSGTARVGWEPADTEGFAGAERVVAFRIAAVVETTGATRLRWGAPEASPFNPA